MVVKSTYTQQQIAPRHSRAGSVAIYLILLLVLAATALFSGWVFFERMDRLYRGAIYPGVYVLGIDVGGMSREEAAEAVAPIAAQMARPSLLLVDQESGTAYAADLGLDVDVAVTVSRAYAVGREDGILGQASVLLTYHDVPPHYTASTGQVREMLEQLRPELTVPPTDATVSTENGEVSVAAGEAGRALDVEATVAQAPISAGDQVQLPLVFRVVPPIEPDVATLTAEAEALMERRIELSAYDLLTGERFSWTVGRETVAAWLRVVRRDDDTLAVAADPEAVKATLSGFAEGLGEGRSLKIEEATDQTLEALEAGGGELDLYLSHPTRSYVVQSGDTLTKIAAQFGMPSGIVAEANPTIDVNRLLPGQELIIPSQDVLLPYLPVAEKKIVVNLLEQKMRVYESDVLIHEWIISTGIPESPTHRGVFQVIGKEEMAYASQWDLWMPYFIAIYPAGGGVNNGIHELPILKNGQRLWAGTLGQPASFGCIILGIPEAETLYTWAELGVPVIIE